MSDIAEKFGKEIFKHQMTKSELLEAHRRINVLESEKVALEKELQTRAKQIGVACLRHDLTHSLACGRCLNIAVEALRVYASDSRWSHGRNELEPIFILLGNETDAKQFARAALKEVGANL